MRRKISEEKSWQSQALNPGQLGEMREHYLCATPPPTAHIMQPLVYLGRGFAIVRSNINIVLACKGSCSNWHHIGQSLPHFLPGRQAGLAPAPVGVRRHGGRREPRLQNLCFRQSPFPVGRFSGGSDRINRMSRIGIVRNVFVG